MQLTFEQLRKHFKQRQLKFTSQRYAIYQALASSKEHPSVEDLYSTVKKSHPALAINTVYKTLDTLKEIGITSQISLWHDKARFDANQTRHHHLVCLHCKKIEDLYDNALDDLALSPKVKHKYRIVGHRVEFHGYCNDCKIKEEDKMKRKTARNLKTIKQLILYFLTNGMMIFGLSHSLLAQEASLAIGPLPNVPIPALNLQSQAKVELGEQIYFDNRLSGNNTRSCASCHEPGAGFTNQTPVGIGTKGLLGRNNPTVYNAAYSKLQSLKFNILGNY